jgi:plastocyanin domain-containing protein
MKGTLIATLIASVLIVGAVWLSADSKTAQPGLAGDGENVAVVDGVQIIDIAAKGGYSPRVSEAQAGVSSILRVSTKGTFDCSSALVIPSLGYRKNLPPSDVTDIELPPQEPGTSLQGLCSMGMYSFTVNFN